MKVPKNPQQMKNINKARVVRPNIAGTKVRKKVKKIHSVKKFSINKSPIHLNQIA